MLDTTDGPQNCRYVRPCARVLSAGDKSNVTGSWIAFDLSDCSDVTHRTNKASGAFGTLCKEEHFGTKYVTYEAKRKAFTGIILSVLLFGCESWCLTADLVGTLANWHRARLR